MSQFWRIVPYFWAHVRKYKLAFFTVFLGYGIGVVGGNLLAPLVVRDIIDVVSSASAVERAQSARELMRLTALFAALGAVYFAGYRIGDFALTSSQSRVMRDLYTDAFRRVGEHSYQFFANAFAGSLVAKVKRFTRSFEMMQDAVSLNLYQTALQLGGTLGILVVVSPALAALFAAWCAVFIAVALAFVFYRQRFDLAEAGADSVVTGRLADVIGNVLNVKMFAAGEAERAAFLGVAEAEHKARSAAWRVNNLQLAAQGFLVILLEIGGMFLAVRLWLAGVISAGTVVLVQAYAGGIFGAVWNLGRSLSRLGRAVSEAAEVVDIFETPLEIRDPEAPERPVAGAGAVEFQNIFFDYEGGVPVFQNFSLAIRAGERVGLVGRSGAGKSTITKLLLRFADVSRGAILVDGQDIRRITQDDLRRKIAYVPQEPLLFHRTLAENIRYGRPDATDEEIVVAARQAHAHEFIEALPAGYATLVGERGVKLSGGERQRVALARAFLKNAPLLVLDEATSSLDSESERYIQEALFKLMEGKTALVIAHRLSTIQRMDRIVVLEGGAIAEEGAHADLLAKDGAYARLWRHQAGGFIE